MHIVQWLEVERMFLDNSFRIWNCWERWCFNYSNWSKSVQFSCFSPQVNRSPTSDNSLSKIIKTNHLLKFSLKRAFNFWAFSTLTKFTEIWMHRKYYSVSTKIILMTNLVVLSGPWIFFLTLIWKNSHLISLFLFSRLVSFSIPMRKIIWWFIQWCANITAISF